MVDKKEFFEELFTPAPQSAKKLIAAWDNITLETQISILQKLSSKDVYFNENYYLWHRLGFFKRLYEKSSRSSSAYIRYLCSEPICKHINDGEDPISKKLLNDPDTLVRHSISTSTLTWEPAEYFSFTQEERLHLIREKMVHGEEFVSLITYALDNLIDSNKITEDELLEILGDYIFRPSFHQETSELWQLIPKMLKIKDAVHLLINNLPPNDYYISDEILGSLSHHQLYYLLQRKHIRLCSYRKKIFFNSLDVPENFDLKMLTQVASEHNFNLTYDEFKSILQMSPKVKERALAILSYAEDIDLVFYEAIKDILDIMGGEDAINNIERSREMLAQKALKPTARHQLIELKLYRHAKAIAPWVDKKKGEWPDHVNTPEYLLRYKSDYLSKYKVEGDTWSTFIRFSSEYTKVQKIFFNKKSFCFVDAELPEINDIDPSFDIESTIEEFLPTTLMLNQDPVIAEEVMTTLLRVLPTTLAQAYGKEEGRLRFLTIVAKYLVVMESQIYCRVHIAQRFIQRQLGFIGIIIIGLLGYIATKIS